MLKWTKEMTYFTIGGLCTILTIALSSLISVDGRIPSEVALIILPTLIDVNAVLIGFWGLILIYGLNFARSARMEAVKCMHEIEIEMSNLEIRKETEKVAHKTFEKIKRSYSASHTGWRDVIHKIDEATRIFGELGIFVTALYIASIMLSILSIGKIQTNGLDNNYLQLSLGTFFTAIAFTWMGIYAIMPEKTK
jgi:hypothetical protein